MHSVTQVECLNCKKLYFKQNKQIKFYPRHLCSRKCKGELEKKTANNYNYYISNAKKRAKLKNIEFDLTIDMLETLFKNQSQKCAFTKVKIHIRKRKASKSLFQASLDRIDNSKGYTIDNVNFVALGFNYMRNSVDLEEAKYFLNSIKLIK